MTTHSNLLEVHHSLLRRFGEKDADDTIKKLENLIVMPSIQNTVEASKFRLRHKGKNPSFTDCLGYVIAEDMKIKFLTGDKKFRGMKNVEFMK